METVDCNLCGHAVYTAVYRVKDTNYGQPGVFTLVRCNQCGLVFTNPRPTAQEIGAFYPAQQYHPFRALQNEGRTKPARRQQQRAGQIAQIVKDSKVQRVLDVGCGSGIFLLAMRERGWEVCGVEPSPEAAEFARTTLKLPVKTGDIFQIGPGLTFDVITFWDVLEHTHSPRDVLLHAHRLLGPKGLLAINVPNWASWERKLFKESWIAIDAPRHLYHFTPDTLNSMLQVCGFEVIEMGTNAPVMNPASNLLRALGSLARRSQQLENDNRGNKPGRNDEQATSALKRWLIRATYLTLTVPNSLVNAVGRGGSVTAYAWKREIGS